MHHYWIASSHNTYLEDNQLTGHSNADMYRRVLVQGCRSVEIDCWDGEPHGARGEPEVTHGMTMCSKVPFADVVAAIADSAFITSDLPVHLSLEMHCSPPQQRKIALLLRNILGSRLLLPASAPRRPCSA